ncbi:hypothetical protein HanRHA438_Chr01g0037841 [Helianthus annuus]|uniref:DUF1639 family protein n=1 Tax=Helianthus annuus TaxID=4232 RepID=A0A251VSF6_HELAN|nr:uncharacterized protein LOC110879242 [Helianthus annuus]KAF5823312.1 hypothetical protein HanXRQr2_Chr01g0036991 [Helianthus annuus]KAJ0628042.1 hypothetical protein HanHA89_Chr01g0032431 [Helianthus annuus]KAJ0949361.1 hypothetical protein HanRHA438_Chr01g0037841 [Helianthus annuus]
MDRLEKSGVVGFKQPETTTDLFLKWGNKKRLRCVRMRDPDDAADPSYAVSGRRRIRRRINSRFVTFPSDNNNNNHSHNNNYNNNNNIKQQASVPSQHTRLTRNSETAVNLRSESHRKPSPEKEVSRPTVSPVDGGVGDQKVKHVWPKLYITLSSKEKEEDFMAMKGCKPSHRPKKRPKAIQRSLLLVSPGAWLTDICQDRYDVIEKKNTKKRPRGLKAMGSMESDSE